MACLEAARPAAARCVVPHELVRSCSEIQVIEAADDDPVTVIRDTGDTRCVCFRKGCLLPSSPLSSCREYLAMHSVSQRSLAPSRYYCRRRKERDSRRRRIVFLPRSLSDVAAWYSTAAAAAVTTNPANLICTHTHTHRDSRHMPEP